MKHVEIVKSVEIGGKLYTCPRAAAKRWVEEAGRSVYCLAHNRNPGQPMRTLRAWNWQSNKCWIIAGKKQRYWRRVLPIFERLLK